MKFFILPMAKGSIPKKLKNKTISGLEENRMVATFETSL